MTVLNGDPVTHREPVARRPGRRIYLGSAAYITEVPQPLCGCSWVTAVRTVRPARLRLDRSLEQRSTGRGKLATAEIRRWGARNRLGHRDGESKFERFGRGAAAATLAPARSGRARETGCAESLSRFRVLAAGGAEPTACARQLERLDSVSGKRFRRAGPLLSVVGGLDVPGGMAA